MSARGSIEAERRLVIDAPAEEVWAWMCEPARLGLFVLNRFHVHAQSLAQRLVPGARVEIEHRFGPARERRVATITALAPYEIAWKETRPGAPDWFPHAQRLVLRPRDEGSCELANRLTGTFRLPGASWWLVPWYRHVLARLLDRENRSLAQAVAAAAAEGSPRPGP